MMVLKGELRCRDCRYSAMGYSSTYCYELHHPRVVDSEDPPCEWFAPKDKIEGGKMKGFTASIGGALRKASRKIVAVKKEFIGTCVGNPFDDMGTLVNVVDNYSEEIDEQEFLANCYVHPEIIEAIRQYPNDFDFHKSKAVWDQPYSIYFYVHSAIEHFYA